MATLYRKTAKGVSEIQTREHRLAPRARSALILVDGRRTDDDLRALILQQPDETLIALVAQGFIEVVDVTAAPHNAAMPAVAPAPQPPALPPVADLRTLCREAVHALNDQVGPMAEPLAIRLERARSFEEIRPLLESAATMIHNVRGGQAAATFRARYLGA